MALPSEVTVSVVDPVRVTAVISAVEDVIHAYDATRSGGAGTALGTAIESLRTVMLELVDDPDVEPDPDPDPDPDATCRAELLHQIAVGLDVQVELLDEPGTSAHWATAGEPNNPP